MKPMKGEIEIDMDDEIRVKVIHGKHKDKIGTLIGIFWGANIANIKTDNGEEISVKPIEITTIN